MKKKEEHDDSVVDVSFDYAARDPLRPTPEEIARGLIDHLKGSTDLSKFDKKQKVTILAAKRALGKK